MDGCYVFVAVDFFVELLEMLFENLIVVGNIVDVDDVYLLLEYFVYFFWGNYML